MSAVLVAGAGGGIGSAVVRAVLADGGAAFGVDRAPERDSRTGGSSQTDSPGQIAPIDITQPGGADEAVAAAKATLGRLDGIVHAIGISGRRLGDGPVDLCTDEAWAEVHRVNYESAFRLLRAGIPALAAGGGGSIAVVGSALATTLDDDFLTVAYASSKGALVPLVRSAAYAGARHGVRVNIVAPGLVDTPMAGRALADPAIVARLPELHRLGGRASTPDEVAAVISWLLSPDAGGITGAVIPADGGWTLR